MKRVSIALFLLTLAVPAYAAPAKPPNADAAIEKTWRIAPLAVTDPRRASSVEIKSGVVRLGNRGMILSREKLGPGTLTLKWRWTGGDDERGQYPDHLAIVLRSNGKQQNWPHEIESGIVIKLNPQDGGNVTVAAVKPGQPPKQLGSKPIALKKETIYSIKVVDQGGLIAISVDGKDLLQAEIQRTAPAEIAIYNREPLEALSQNSVIDGLEFAPTRGAFAGQAVRLSRPVKIATTAADKSRFAGQVTWHDELGFELVDDKERVRVVRWPELSAQSAYDLYDKILGKGTGEEWVQAGWVLRNLTDGAALADRAFGRALRLDGKLQSEVDKAKFAVPPAGEPGEKLLIKGWPRLTDAQHNQAVAELKKSIAQTPELKSLKLYETKYFLFYTDLPPDEGTRWASLLDKMYARLAEMFGLDVGRNIWAGKAVVIVFQKAADFRNYEQKVYKRDPKDFGGFCHYDGSGKVNIDFYRSDDELDFAHLLVHEATHGFIHRFRTPTEIPSWVNEGLAQWMAAKLVPNKRAEDWRRDRGRAELQKTPIADVFFTAEQIPLTQYGIAETLCGFMIARNPNGYVDFINGIKDGMKPEISLEKKFGVVRDRLISDYQRSFLSQGGK